MTTKPTNPLIAARRGDSDRRRRRVIDALDRLRTDGAEITVSAVARTAGVDRSFLYRHHDLRSQILALAAEPEPHPASTHTSRRSLLADIANLRAHSERLRHQNAKLAERLSEVLGEQVFHNAGLTRTDEISALRERTAAALLVGAFCFVAGWCSARRSSRAGCGCQLRHRAQSAMGIAGKPGLGNQLGISLRAGPA